MVESESIYYETEGNCPAQRFDRGARAHPVREHRLALLHVEVADRVPQQDPARGPHLSHRAPLAIKITGGFYGKYDGIRPAPGECARSLPQPQPQHDPGRCESRGACVGNAME